MLQRKMDADKQNIALAKTIAGRVELPPMEGRAAYSTGCRVTRGFTRLSGDSRLR
jgi:hypothetical protein